MSFNILEDCVPENEFAADHNLSPKTTSRYRKEPDGLPFVKFGGRVYIPKDLAREWLVSRIKHAKRQAVA